MYRDRAQAAPPVESPLCPLAPALAAREHMHPVALDVVFVRALPMPVARAAFREPRSERRRERERRGGVRGKRGAMPGRRSARARARRNAHGD